MTLWSISGKYFRLESEILIEENSHESLICHLKNYALENLTSLKFNCNFQTLFCLSVVLTHHLLNWFTAKSKEVNCPRVIENHWSFVQNYFSIIKGATTLYSFVSASPSLTTEVSACVQMLKYYQSPVHRFLYFLQDITGTIRIIFDENKIQHFYLSIWDALITIVTRQKYNLYNVFENDVVQRPCLRETEEKG